MFFSCSRHFTRGRSAKRSRTYLKVRQRLFSAARTVFCGRDIEVSFYFLLGFNTFTIVRFLIEDAVAWNRLRVNLASLGRRVSMHFGEHAKLISWLVSVNIIKFPAQIINIFFTYDLY